MKGHKENESFPKSVRKYLAEGLRLCFNQSSVFSLLKRLKQRPQRTASWSVKYEFKSYRKQLFFREFVLIFLVAEENLVQ